MAQKTVVELVDDLDGGEADETVVFALDGVDFTIDLSAENANRLRDTLAEYVGRARRTDSRKGGKATLHSVNTRLDTQAVREWARSRGEDVAERGRLSHDLVIRFQAAHEA
ncbi:MAG: Lsr2 family protein [Labedaea sp.]